MTRWGKPDWRGGGGYWICVPAARLLCRGGSMLLVQSALANFHRSLEALRTTGLEAEVVAAHWIAFGPVLSARAGWLERTGRIPRGCRWSNWL